jgi:hypothetical protein
MQTTQIQRISCVVCLTRLGNQKTKKQQAANEVARAYCPKLNCIETQTPLTKSYNFRNVFG